MNDYTLKFEVEVTEDDFLEFQKVYPELVKNREHERKDSDDTSIQLPGFISSILAWIIITLFFEALFLISAKLLKIGHIESIAGTVATAVCIVGILFHFGDKIFARFITPQINARGIGKHSYLFTNNELEYVSEYVSCQYWWQFIEGYEETETQFYITFSEYLYFIIPKHSLQPPHVLEEIKEFVSEKITVNTARRVCNQTE